MTDTVDKSIDEQLDEVLKNIIHIGYVYGYNQLAQMANVAPYNQVQPITEEEAKQSLLTLIEDLIGEDELSASVPLEMPEQMYVRLKGRDQLRKELRERLR